MNDNGFLIGHINDLIARESRGETMVFSAFLTSEESAIAAAVCHKQKAPFLLWGGYDDAERKMLAVSDLDMDMLKLCCPIVLLQFLGDVEKLTNRDVLGSLLASGLRRDVLGDIIVRDGLVLVFVSEHIKDFIMNNVSSIGRTKVTVKELSPDFKVPERRYEELRFTIASMRMDAVVGGLTHLSREQACRLIDGKMVAINHVPVEKKTKEVHSGDCVVIRGHGKWIIDSCQDLTRKGRIILNCKKYI